MHIEYDEDTFGLDVMIGVAELTDRGIVAQQSDRELALGRHDRSARSHARIGTRSRPNGHLIGMLPQLGSGRGTPAVHVRGPP